MIEVAAPARLNGNLLADEIGAAVGYEVDVTYRPSRGVVVVSAADGDEGTVRGTVEAHDPPEPGPDPDEEFRQAIEGATSVADLKAALLGTSGPGAEPRRGRSA